MLAAGDMTEKLKILYRLHLPPALLPSDPDDLEAAKSGEFTLQSLPANLSSDIDVLALALIRSLV